MSWERVSSRASLNLYFGIKKKKELDLRERPNLGPNEYFFKYGESYHEIWPETMNTL